MAQIVGREPGTVAADTTVLPDAYISGAQVLQIKRLSKTFGATRALQDVNIDIRAGEIHALVGHNGSGKSTLIKCLSGYHVSDPGLKVWWQGNPSSFAEIASDSSGAAMRFVHQDLGLIDQMSAIENFALHGSYSRGRLHSVDWRAQEHAARRAFHQFGVTLDPRLPLTRATPLERTIVAIAIALQGLDESKGMLVLDEPTAVLSPLESKELFRIVRRLQARGTAILYVSHRMQEVLDLADRASVLRDGKLVATVDAETLNHNDLVGLMLGEQIATTVRDSRPGFTESSTMALEVEDLHGSFINGVTFDIRAGETVGIAGLPDDGRDEIPQILGGASSARSGRIRLPQRQGPWTDIREWNRSGLSFVPADRGRLGVLAQMSVLENFTLSALSSFGGAFRLDRADERRQVNSWVRDFDVRVASVDQRIATLSGGNQQKVVIGRSLAGQPDVLVMCEPTAGVDVGTRNAIYRLLAQRVEQGLAILLTSTDVDDLLALCDRILIVRSGTIAEVLTGTQISERRLVHAMEGLTIGH